MNPNVSDFKGLTPLMTASMFGKTSTASFLLGMGALHHLTDINGDTALHWASYKGHPELIRLLLYSGADLTKADNFGSTPLHLAALSGNAKCVQILCQNVSEKAHPVQRKIIKRIQIYRVKYLCNPEIRTAKHR